MFIISISDVESFLGRIGLLFASAFVKVEDFEARRNHGKINCLETGVSNMPTTCKSSPRLAFKSIEMKEKLTFG
jgi:hypothetical protein